MEPLAGATRRATLLFGVPLSEVQLCLRAKSGRAVTVARTDGGRRLCSGCVVPRRVAEKGLGYIYCRSKAVSRRVSLDQHY